MSAADGVLEALARVLAPHVARLLRDSHGSELVSQKGSPLGRRHSRIVRERIARGDRARIESKPTAPSTRDAAAEFAARFPIGRTA